MLASRHWMMRPLALLRRQPWPMPAPFPSLDPSQPIEEENTPYYDPKRFYPAHLGQVLNDRYQLVNKLGYGSSSTVWLARDLCHCRWLTERYVAVKISANRHHSRDSAAARELEMLRRISTADPSHPGWEFVRKLLDSFVVDGAFGSHVCLVFEPLREPLWLFRRRFVDDVIPSDILKIMLQMTLQGLDYLHSECHVIHTGWSPAVFHSNHCLYSVENVHNVTNHGTDLKMDNIMVMIEDPSMLDRYARDELDNPLPQKQCEDGRLIYLSRNNYGKPAAGTGMIRITDFDLAVAGDSSSRMGSIQADVYRAPEVILEAGYTYSADIWNLGVLLWDLLEGRPLFEAVDELKGAKYDEKKHLAYISALLGPAPTDLLNRGRRTSIFYRPDGNLGNAELIPKDFSFENNLSRITGEDKAMFIDFVKRMIMWRPEERSSAKGLLTDPWLHADFPSE
ncbi:Uncharacterized protein TPAR_07878 [Tolypocladium paradoxum]|uniref:non-specific serine/threonine protein kinase n=1 Tax=Tolypocladium paradoxum TaxID=94208 RepID=A0A2S4KP02_9HYPO|nr:Uncharacterized protein TPAR_07878 [Tolypocladium paradoxum]